MTNITPGPRIGSLFSGYGGLDLGVQAVFGGSVAWHCDFEPAPSKILEARFPDVPNYGDVTAVDWGSVEPVEILTGGFPCQDLSLAGRRGGMRAGTRSGLWADYLKAIDVLRPKLVIIENVRGLLSGCAESDLESCPGCVGDGEHRPVLRALGRVLADLAALGYDAEWCPVRASDAGAPHGRYRVFVVAYPRGEAVQLGDRQASGGPETIGRGRPRDGRRAQAPADPSHDGCGGHSELDGGAQRPRLEAPQRVDADGRPVADTAGGGRDGRAQDTFRESIERATAARSGGSTIDWGPYEPAISRWERVTGRVAPNPTNPDGRDGSHRLAAEFVEWMMGLPAGWVTSKVIGLTRHEQLKALGNGVVWQQAALALRQIMARSQPARHPWAA